MTDHPNCILNGFTVMNFQPLRPLLWTDSFPTALEQFQYSFLQKIIFIWSSMTKKNTMFNCLYYNFLYSLCVCVCVCVISCSINDKSMNMNMEYWEIAVIFQKTSLFSPRIAVYHMGKFVFWVFLRHIYIEVQIF